MPPQAAPRSSSKTVATPFALGLIVALAFAAACTPLANDYDRKRAVCGEDVVAGAPLLRIADEDGQPMTGGDLAALAVDGSSARALPVSRLGCVAVTGAADAVFVKTKDGRAGLSGAPASFTGDWDEARRLSPAPAHFTRATLTARCAASPEASAEARFALQGTPGAGLGLYRVSYRVRDAEGQVLWAPPAALTNAAQEPSLALPATLPEADLTLEVESENLFDTVAGLAAPAVTHCPLRIDRSAPEGGLAPLEPWSGTALAMPWIGARAVRPGGELRFAWRDRSDVTLMACLKELNEGDDDARAQATCAESDYAPRKGRLNAPEQGSWVLSYYGVDALGQRGPLRTVVLAVVHDETIASLRSALAASRLALAEGRAFDAIPGVLAAATSFLRLSLDLEKASVRDDLVGTFLGMGHALAYDDRVPLSGEDVKSLHHAGKTGATAVVYGPGGAQFFGADRRQAAWDDAIRDLAWSDALGSYVARAGDAVVLVDAQGRRGRAIVSGKARGFRLAADGLHAAVWGPDGLARWDLRDGTSSAPRAFDGNAWHVHDVSADGRLALLGATDGSTVEAWDLVKGAVVGSYAPADTACVVMSAAFAPDASHAFVASGDQREPKPFLLLDGTATPQAQAAARAKSCGLVAWDLGQGKRLLTYTLGTQTFTTNGDVKLAVTGDGRTLVAATQNLNVLPYWRIGAEEGHAKALDARTDMSVSFLATAGRHVVVGTHPGGVFVLDQSEDLDGDDVSRRITARFPLPRDNRGTLSGALSPDGQTLIVADKRNEMRFHSVGGSPFRSLPTAHPQAATAWGRTKDGPTLFYQDGDKTVRRLALDGKDAQGRTFADAPGSGTAEPVTAMAWTARGLVLAGESRWRLVDGDSGRTLTAHDIPGASTQPGGAFMKAYGQGERLLLIAADAASLWRPAATGKAWEELKTWPGAFTHAAFNADGSRLALLGGDFAGQSLAMIDARTGQSVVDGLAVGEDFHVDGEFTPFDPSGRRVMTVSSQAIRIHDAATGRVLQELSPQGRGQAWVKARFAPAGEEALFAIAQATAGHAMHRLSYDGRDLSAATPWPARPDYVIAPPGARAVYGRAVNETGIHAWGADGRLLHELADGDKPFDDLREYPGALIGIDVKASRINVWPLHDAAWQLAAFCRRLAGTAAWGAHPAFAEACRGR